MLAQLNARCAAVHEFFQSPEHSGESLVKSVVILTKSSSEEELSDKLAATESERTGVKWGA